MWYFLFLRVFFKKMKFRFIVERAGSAREEDTLLLPSRVASLARPVLSRVQANVKWKWSLKESQSKGVLNLDFVNFRSLLFYPYMNR